MGEGGFDPIKEKIDQLEDLLDVDATDEMILPYMTSLLNFDFVFGMTDSQKR
jgi:hypothetical protein